MVQRLPSRFKQINSIRWLLAFKVEELTVPRSSDWVNFSRIPCASQPGICWTSSRELAFGWVFWDKAILSDRRTLTRYRNSLRCLSLVMWSMWKNWYTARHWYWGTLSQLWGGLTLIYLFFGLEFWEHNCKFSVQLLNDWDSTVLQWSGGQNIPQLQCIAERMTRGVSALVPCCVLP